MIEFIGDFYLLRDANNPGAKPLDFEAGMRALATAGGFELTAGTREAFEQILLEIGKKIKQTIVKEITAGVEAEPTPLAETTVYGKGHSGWLYDIGEFVNNLEVELIVGGAGAPGGLAGVALVPRGAASHDSTFEAWQVAHVLLHGATIRITDPATIARVIGYLKAAGIPPASKDELRGDGDNEYGLKAGITIVIPPRKLLPTVLEGITNEQAITMLRAYIGKRMELAVHTLNSRPWDESTVREVATQGRRAIELIKGTGPF